MEHLPTPYEDEIVDAELLPPDHPGPRTDEDAAEAPRPGRSARIAAAARGVLGSVVRQVGTGCRHAHQLTRHFATAASVSDEELRRLLVKKQLTRHTSLREEADERTAEVRKQLQRLDRRAAADGWTKSDQEQAKDLRAELAGRERAQTGLATRPFTPIQPTADQITSARTRTTWKRAAGLLACTCGALYGAVQAPGALLLALPVSAAALWWLGRSEPVLTERPVPEALLLPELDAPALEQTPAAQEPAAEEPAPEPETNEAAPGTDPFPIARATTGEEVTECLRRALVAEGVKVEEVHSPERTPWGWQATATLRSGTSATVVKALRDLDTLLKVGEGRTLAQGDPNASANVRIRVLMSDPFAAMPEAVHHAPRSLSILNPADLGLSIDGETTEVILAGQHVIIVAVTGGGKSAMVRVLADHITACDDAVIVDIDPTGRGLGPMRDAAVLRAYDDDSIEQALEALVAEAERRIADLPPHIDNWIPTPDAPSLHVAVDEYPQLTRRAKQLVLKLLRIGRKARVTVILCTQDATADIMGDAVADSFGIRVLMPCREADVPVVLGDRTAIGKGWLPHVLIPSPGEHDPADAGTFYLLAPRHRAPIMRKTRHITAADAVRRTAERVNAGMTTLVLDGVGSEEPAELTRDVRQLLEDVIDVIDKSPEDRIHLDQLAADLAAYEPVRYRGWTRDDVGEALRSAGVRTTTVRVAGTGRKGVYRQDVADRAGTP
ncbi:type IV secretory system conjugative DNA transfer family protein [Streptomyces roseicoloratus]|uniref:type IV secretory system conjugative DNA transfer family protein n=1 Tax=Streptomyces roseicoloratus TaxID=2508722 RepID=UPI001009A9D6|nr:type IV secretory system conjugative DNA transfer family protein [Streptomyces roseicoloratus]